jgi:hypothetical protein
MCGGSDGSGVSSMAFPICLVITLTVVTALAVTTPEAVAAPRAATVGHADRKVIVVLRNQHTNLPLSKGR